jgi:hypothetical protein
LLRTLCRRFWLGFDFQAGAVCRDLSLRSRGILLDTCGLLLLARLELRSAFACYAALLFPEQSHVEAEAVA